MTPQDYLKNELKLNMDDYVDIISYKQQPFWKQVEYEVPDNWWHDASYYNMPLADYMQALKSAIKNGYSIAIGGDVSEPGFNSWEQVALIPDFDIPFEYINDDARQFRFGKRNHNRRSWYAPGWLSRKRRTYLVSGKRFRFRLQECG